MELIHILASVILFSVGIACFIWIFLDETPWFARILLLIFSLSIFDVLFK